MPDFTRARRSIEMGIAALDMAQRSAENGRPNPDRERQAARALRSAADELEGVELAAPARVPVGEMPGVEVGSRP